MKSGVPRLDIFRRALKNCNEIASIWTCYLLESERQQNFSSAIQLSEIVESAIGQQKLQNFSFILELRLFELFYIARHSEAGFEEKAEGLVELIKTRLQTMKASKKQAAEKGAKDKMIDALFQIANLACFKFQSKEILTSSMEALVKHRGHQADAWLNYVQLLKVLNF